MLAADCITDCPGGRRRRRQDHGGASARREPRGEPALLERMISNLLENGIRHNERGGWLDVSTETTNGDVRLAVRNGGELLDPALVAELAEPFKRAHRHREGFGLGLSIVRSVALAHGGDVALSAPPDGGLLAVVTLPQHRRPRFYGELTTSELQPSQHTTSTSR